MAWKASLFFSCCMDFPTWSHLAKLSCACFSRDRVGALYCQARLSLKFVDCIAVSRTYRLNSLFVSMLCTVSRASRSNS